MNANPGFIKLFLVKVHDYFLGTGFSILNEQILLCYFWWQNIFNIYQLLAIRYCTKTSILWDKKGFLKLFAFFCLGNCRDGWWTREVKRQTAGNE